MTQAPPTSRRGIIIGAVIGLVVLVAVIVGITGSSSEVARPPAASDAPDVTSIYMTCVPNDSTVTRVDDGTVLGRTPLTLTFPRGNGQVSVVVHRDGYQDRVVNVPLFSETGRIDVELTSLDASTHEVGTGATAKPKR